MFLVYNRDCNVERVNKDQLDYNNKLISLKQKLYFSAVQMNRFKITIRLAGATEICNLNPITRKCMYRKIAF